MNILIQLFKDFISFLNYKDYLYPSYSKNRLNIS